MTPVGDFLSVDLWFIETWVGLLPVEKRTRYVSLDRKYTEKLKEILNASLYLSSTAGKLSLGGSRGMEGMWIFKVIFAYMIFSNNCTLLLKELLRSFIFLKFIFNEKNKASSLIAHSKPL